MCETPVLFSTRLAGLVEDILHEIVAKKHACMMTEEIMDIYQGRPFYIIVTSFSKVYVHLPKHQKVGTVADAPSISSGLRTNVTRTPGAQANNSDSSVNEVH